MKNVFGAKNDNQQNENLKFDGEVFVTARLNSVQQAEIDAIYDESQSHTKKMNLPLSVTIIKIILLVVGLIILGGILKADVGIREAYNNAPHLFFICIAALAIAGIIQITEIIRRKKFIKSDEYNDFLRKSDVATKKAMSALNIPQNSQCVDILCYIYKDKKGKTVSNCVFDFFPSEMYIYSDDENLYLADHTSVFTFFRNEIVKIEKINKKATMAIWNKEEHINSKKYKKYKMTQDKSGLVRIRDYYRLYINSRYGEYEILVPPYEIEAVAELIGMKNQIE